jgi:eukaryotic-like serine/threonine-protein kinase
MVDGSLRTRPGRRSSSVLPMIEPVEPVEPVAAREAPSGCGEGGGISGIEPRAASRWGWSAVPLDAEASRRLVQQRVGFFGGVFLLLSVAFYLRNALAIAVLSAAAPPFGHPAFLFHVGAIALHATQWSWCRFGRLSPRQLDALDALGLLGAMVLYGAVTVAEAMSLEHAVAVQSAGAEVLLVAIILLALVLTHAIIVPLDARRMFALSAAAAALGVTAAYLVARVGLPPALLEAKPWLPLNQVIFVGMWGVVAVTVATIAARVIHGLSQRVRDANEVGQYMLEERIGEGGMGVVYLARHALLRRPTAVKLLPPGRAGEQAISRFEREVRLTSSLTHPNTIAIFDFGRTPDGMFYYAMEYLDGITLEHLTVFDGPQPASRVIHLLKQACGALGEAHALGLVHRDIKPANLMLCIRGNMPDQIKVLDFGLVKEHAPETALGLSTEGMLLGTPAYLAPEAILHPARADARSDLYALAAVGYWLLVAQSLFPSQSVLEVCLHHLHTPPVPPSERSPHPIPPALDALLLRCLSKDADARPASALELAQLLDAIEAPPWTRDQGDRWWRERAPLALAAVKQSRRGGDTPGPRTIAVDVQRRTPRSALQRPPA